jgi:predicted dehydrogenase
MFGYPKKGAYLMSHTRSTRRDFLKRSTGVVAAGVAAPFVWTGSHAGAASKNDRIGVAAIGVSTYVNRTEEKKMTPGRGSGIGYQASKLGDMVACCDVNRAHAERFRTRYGLKCDILGDYRKLLERKDVDAVTIGTPDHWHTAISIDAMKAGKDVYCEKPLTLTIDEGKLICKVAKETGRVFQVGTQQRSECKGLPFLKAVVIARSGRLGKLRGALVSIGTGTRGGPFQNTPPPKELDWDFWLGPAPKVPYCKERCDFDFRWWLEYSGGQVTDWGVHHTDIAMWAMGLDHTGPEEIEGTGDYPRIENGYNTAVTFDCTMKFAGDQEIRLYSGGNELIISGEKGRIRVNRGGLTGKPVEELTEKDHEWINEEIIKLCKGKTPGSHMRNFFECMRDRSLPISDVFTHHRSVSACHLANIAMRLGRKLRWDPAKEIFPDDDEANAMLSREQRKPYGIDD